MNNKMNNKRNSKENNARSNQKTHRFLFTIGSIIALAIMLPIQAGCTDLQGAIGQSSAWRTKAVDVQENLQAQLQSLEQQREQLPTSSPDSPYLDAAISRTKAKIQSINAAVIQADLVLQEASNPQGSLTKAVDAISPWIPAPVQGPALLGAALFATLVRSKKLKDSAASIIQSIEYTMNRDPEFKRVFTQNADTIRTIQTPGARKLIDSTVNKSQSKK